LPQLRPGQHAEAQQQGVFERRCEGERRDQGGETGRPAPRPGDAEIVVRQTFRSGPVFIKLA
jgi:hypothetical protein